MDSEARRWWTSRRVCHLEGVSPVTVVSNMADNKKVESEKKAENEKKDVKKDPKKGDEKDDELVRYYFTLEPFPKWYVPLDWLQSSAEIRGRSSSALLNHYSQKCGLMFMCFEIKDPRYACPWNRYRRFTIVMWCDLSDYYLDVCSHFVAVQIKSTNFTHYRPYTLYVLHLSKTNSQGFAAVFLFCVKGNTTVVRLNCQL